MVTPHVFEKKEILIPVKCDVHKWMGAFIAVVDNPSQRCLLKTASTN
jgi:hypothetical protein